MFHLLLTFMAQIIVLSDSALVADTDDVLGAAITCDVPVNFFDRVITLLRLDLVNVLGFKNGCLQLVVFLVAVFVHLTRQNFFEVLKILVVYLAAAITFLAFFTFFVQGGSLAFIALNKISLI